MYGEKPFSEILEPLQHVTLSAYNGEQIKCVGTIKLKCQFNNSQFHESLLYVVDVPDPAIVGLPSRELIKLVKINCECDTLQTSKSYSSVNDLKKMYPEQFDKIGNFEGTAKPYLQPDAKPYCDPHRKCSIHLRGKVKSELQRLEKTGVIRKVNEYTDWCSSITYINNLLDDARLRYQHWRKSTQRLQRQNYFQNWKPRQDIGLYTLTNPANSSQPSEHLLEDYVGQDYHLGYQLAKTFFNNT